MVDLERARKITGQYPFSPSTGNVGKKFFVFRDHKGPLIPQARYETSQARGKVRYVRSEMQMDAIKAQRKTSYQTKRKSISPLSQCDITEDINC